MNTVIIIGSGAAGLAAAIEAVRNGSNAVIVTKKLYNNNNYQWQSDGGCTWKTHAFNAAVGEFDSIDKHIHDTLIGGAQANNPSLVRLLCEKSVDLVQWLVDLGIDFSKGDNKFSLKPFGGCEVSRAVFIEDRLGFYIQKQLLLEIDTHINKGNIKVFEGLRFISLIKDDYNEVTGVELINLATFEIFDLKGSSVIIADGGGAAMYSPCAVSNDKTCDGIIAAFNAGIELIDMEFVQFHPTGLITNVLPFTGSLVEEAVRFLGAKLLNKDGISFMLSYDERCEFATRDIVARAIFTEVLAGRGFENRFVHLDISDCYEIIIQEYPALYERLKQADFEIEKIHKIPVLPTAHFLMGGIKINDKMQSNFSNVFAAGESCGGIHGANRLGGNGLSEALVTGRLAGMNASCIINNNCNNNIFRINRKKLKNISTNLQTDNSFLPEHLLINLQTEMYKFAGLIKNDFGLTKMINTINTIQEMFDNSIILPSGARASKHYSDYLDTQNLLIAAKIIVEASIKRKESRGSHFRTDFPKQLPNYFYNSVKKGENKKMIWKRGKY